MNHTTRINPLLIEDVPIMAMNLAGRLEGEGYRIVGSTTNGPKALDAVRCDVVIKDE
ncbi:response regulator [Spirosoma rhododendri]|uniref:Response regulator n=1 Tax=Spirosoma rhododendri TaxID=2728024 RepID=A0A7L5DYD5_9BACT|nr:hypothetical protein [Spirosoma rhododendri]QJD81628.1 response regulator [Spirosoma rhododendri]